MRRIVAAWRRSSLRQSSKTSRSSAESASIMGAEPSLPACGSSMDLARSRLTLSKMSSGPPDHPLGAGGRHSGVSTGNAASMVGQGMQTKLRGALVGYGFIMEKGHAAGYQQRATDADD